MKGKRGGKNDLFGVLEAALAVTEPTFISGYRTGNAGFRVKKADF